MKYCSHCGAEILDEAVVCVHCGCSVARTASSDRNTLRTITKIFMILGCVLSGFYLLIPLCWTIPMTRKYCRAIENNEPVSLGFKICSLIFVSLVAGILMLCDEESTARN